MTENYQESTNEKLSERLYPTIILLATLCIMILVIYILFLVPEPPEPAEREYDGLWFNNYKFEDVDSATKEYDPRGDWVCVNIKGMSWERAVEVIQHEVGHEMFAEACEKNITKCMGALDE